MTNERFSEARAAKEVMKAMAMGLIVEKKTMEPAAVSFKEILGFYLSTILSGLIRSLTREIDERGTIFQRSGPDYT